MQTQARILAFKELANLIAELDDEDREDEWHHVGAALCWAGGCRCEEAQKFEAAMLDAAESIGTLKGVEIRDIHGNAIDLASQLAIGVPEEAVKRAEAKGDK